MTSTNPKVLSYVEAAIKRNPNRTSKSLYEAAVKIDPEISKLDLRRFHSRYPLQVRRKLQKAQSSGEAKTNGKPRKPKRRKDDRRQEVRDILLEFASKVASSLDSRKDLVEVIGNLDTYVDRLV